jgi:hypothetical protein
VTSRNPAVGSKAWRAAVHIYPGPLHGVSCPSSRLCVGVGVGDGGSIVISTAPTAPDATWTAPRKIAPSSLTGIACPSTRRCVAIDARRDHRWPRLRQSSVSFLQRQSACFCAPVPGNIREATPCEARPRPLLICARVRCQALVPHGAPGLVVAVGGACAHWMVRLLCARAPSLILGREPAVRRLGDMMVDGVIPLGEAALRPLGLSGPSTRTWRQQNAGEPAAVHR